MPLKSVKRLLRLTTKSMLKNKSIYLTAGFILIPLQPSSKYWREAGTRGSIWHWRAMWEGGEEATLLFCLGQEGDMSCSYSFYKAKEANRYLLVSIKIDNQIRELPKKM